MYYNQVINIDNKDNSFYSECQPSEQACRNVVLELTDTMVSRLIKQRTRARFVTNDADDITQERAVNLTWFADAVQYRNDFQKQCEQTLQEGSLLGTSWMKIWPDEVEKQVKLQSVPINEVYVPVTRDKIPRELFHRHTMSRRQALMTFGASEDEFVKQQIVLAGSTKIDGTVDDDVIEIIECWMFEPWNDEDTSGRHCVVIGGCAVQDEHWPYPVPFVPFRFKTLSLRFWGAGIGELCLPEQLKINDLIKWRDGAVAAFGFPKIGVPIGSPQSSEAYTDEIGSRVEFDPVTGPPKVLVANRVTCSEVNDTIELTIRGAYTKLGMNEASAIGTTQTGANASGAAKREEVDIQSDRFMAHAFAYEAFHVEVAKAIIQAAKRLYKNGSKVQLRSNEGTMKKIDWRDVNMEDDGYSIRCNSASTLSQSNAGRTQQISEMMEQGYISQQQGMEMMGSLDTDAIEGLSSAPVRSAKALIRKVIRDETWELPGEYYDLQQIVDIGRKTWNQLVIQDDQEEACERLTDFLDSVIDELEPPVEQQPPAAAPAPPMMQQAPPQPQAMLQ
jgi:hypothetical protein